MTVIGETRKAEVGDQAVSGRPTLRLRHVPVGVHTYYLNRRCHGGSTRLQGSISNAESALNNSGPRARRCCSKGRLAGSNIRTQRALGRRAQKFGIFHTVAMRSEFPSSLTETALCVTDTSHASAFDQVHFSCSAQLTARFLWSSIEQGRRAL